MKTLSIKNNNYIKYILACLISVIVTIFVISTYFKSYFQERYVDLVRPFLLWLRELNVTYPWIPISLDLLYEFIQTFFVNIFMYIFFALFAYLLFYTLNKEDIKDKQIKIKNNKRFLVSGLLLIMLVLCAEPILINLDYFLYGIESSYFQRILDNFFTFPYIMPQASYVPFILAYIFLTYKLIKSLYLKGDDLKTEKIV